MLRALEHRLQLRRMMRTHIVPEAEDDLRRLGRSFGFRANPARELTDLWRRNAVEVRRLHEKLFYRPLLGAAARLTTDEARLTPEAASARFSALGYPWAPAIFVIASAAMVVNSFWRDPGSSLAGAALIGVGVPVYYVIRRR
jgi:glutamine synthetase adenylyltransferase